MKTLITLLWLLVSMTLYGQFPILEEFNPGTSWTFSNGSGIQNYGGAENYASTNLGTTPYPNNANINITSPLMNLTNCLGVMTVSFPLSGQVENNFDFLRFEYRIGGGAWTTVASYTGNQNTTYTYTNIPATATQFRFRLQTDNTVNSYTTGPWWNQTVYVYYYDIQRFSITCSAVLPVELLSFNGYNENQENVLV